ncbi:effector-associated constant component EACC1 [Streptosporangium sp. NPDC002607]
MDIEISVSEPDSVDAANDLYEWLVEEPELAGRVRSLEAPPVPGTLGPLTEALRIALEPGGAVMVLATLVVAWLRYRTGKVTITIVTKDGESRVDVLAERVKALDAAGTQALVSEVVRAVEGQMPDEGGA